jgi:hypothetical protein
VPNSSLRIPIGITLATLGAACGGCMWAHSIVETGRDQLPRIMMIIGIPLWIIGNSLLLYPALQGLSAWKKTLFIAIVLPALPIMWFIAGLIAMFVVATIMTLS